MKIIHVPFCFYPDPVGGTETYVAALADGQQRCGVEALIVVPGESDAVYEHHGLRVRRFALGPVAALSDLYGAGDALGAAAFARILDDEWPDLVHLHAFTRGVSLRLALEAKRRGIPVVFTYHTPTVSCQRGTLLRWGHEICDGRLDVARCAACALQSRGLPLPASVLLGRAPVELGMFLGDLGLRGGMWTALRTSELVELRHQAVRALLTEVDAIVALCGWSRDLLLRNGVAASRITVSRHGLPDTLCVPQTPQAGRQRSLASVSDQSPLRIAFLGRLDPAKGVDVLIQALRALPSLPVEFDIYGICQAGAENYVAALQRMAAGDARIAFLPPSPGAQVVELLSGYDLLAAPSRWLETGPLVVLEAFSAGIPVIGSRLGGIAELVTHKLDGLLVEPDAPDAWSAALKRLCEQPALLKRLRSGVRPPRQIDRVVDEMLEIYNLLLTNARASQPLANDLLHGTVVG
jgi:glycosyltransferase involved in cell wall biosynthesis